MKLKRRSQIAALIALASLLVACNDATLAQVAKDLDIAAKTVGAVQTTVIQANQAKLIPDSDTKLILQACIQVNQAGQEAVAFTKTISQLDEPSRTKLVNLLTPAITSVGNLVQNGTLGIKDQGTQQRIQLLLSSLQATLSGIQIAISGGN